MLRRIAKLSSEAEWTPDETRQTLLEAGIRPQEITDSVLRLVTQLKKDSPFHWRNRAATIRRELLEKVQTRVRTETWGLTRPQLLDKVNETIRRLPAPAADQYAVAFRKFEDATEDDLRSILEELALLSDLENEQ
jgi:hypothetical protein